MNSYNSEWGFDHDDGSSHYYDHHNVFLYAGSKNFEGNSKHTYNNLFAYVDYPTDPSNPSGARNGSIYCSYTFFPGEHKSGWGESWTNNSCILTRHNNPYNYFPCSLDNKDIYPLSANNTFYIDQPLRPVCDVAYSWAAWLNNSMDIGSTVQPVPSTATVTQLAKNVLEW
jgi:hypothetical protein